jgi:cellulose biosynthesis protein BcsQ
VVAVMERTRRGPAATAAGRRGPAQRGIVVAIAHQKGGVGKSTSAALLAAEIAWVRPGWSILVDDRDPDRNLTARWPGDTANVQLVEPGQGTGHLRLIDTGPGNADQLDQVLVDADYVVVPVRLESMSTQSLGLFLPRLEAVQRVNGGAPVLAGFVLTHYAARVAGHVRIRAEMEDFAAGLGTRVLGIIPFSAQVGLQLSTRGHLYRPAALRLLEVLDGRA